MKYLSSGDVVEIGQLNVLHARFVRGICCRQIISSLLFVSLCATAQTSTVRPEVHDEVITETQPKPGEELTTPSGATIRFAAPRPPAHAVRARSEKPSEQLEPDAAPLDESTGHGGGMYTPLETSN